MLIHFIGMTIQNTVSAHVILASDYLVITLSSLFLREATFT